MCVYIKYTCSFIYLGDSAVIYLGDSAVNPRVCEGGIADLQGSFADMHDCFTDTQGSFADIHDYSAASHDKGK